MHLKEPLTVPWLTQQNPTSTVGSRLTYKEK